MKQWFLGLLAVGALVFVSEGTASAQNIYTAAGCANRVARPGKRVRCIQCVNLGGVFQKQGAGRGFCYRPSTAGRIVSVRGCQVNIARPGKRGRCIACVSTGGIFFRQGAGRGFCWNRGVIRSIPACRAIVRVGKRRRCIACVRRGRTFFRYANGGAGFCR